METVARTTGQMRQSISHPLKPTGIYRSNVDELETSPLATIQAELEDLSDFTIADKPPRAPNSLFAQVSTGAERDGLLRRPAPSRCVRSERSSTPRPARNYAE
jgi:hypothetical protein